jgi:hypothetical protein
MATETEHVVLKKPIGNFPYKIRFRGLPLFLQGWNTVFTKAESLDPNGNPFYILESYVYLWSVPIIGCTIRKVDGIWVLCRNCDCYDDWICRKVGDDQESPAGNWTMGHVTKNTKYFYWF